MTNFHSDSHSNYRNDQVSDAETAKILSLARASLEIPGDFVELGCFRGDTSLLLAEFLRDCHSPKSLWLYDSFEGLPEKSSADRSASGTAFQPGALQVSKRTVKSRFLRANLKLPHIVKAWFSDLKPSDLPEKVAFAFLDGDFYDSIKVSLALVIPKVSSGAFILIHDYQNPALPGVTTAVDEFLRFASAQLTSEPSPKLTPTFSQYHSLAILHF